MMKFILPTYIDIPRKTKKDKRIYLNLNVYRNLNFHVNNQVKIKFKDMVSNLANIKFNPPIRLIYQIHVRTRRKMDKMNVITVVDKFFCDALTFYNCIPDDNDNYVGEIIIKETKYNPEYEYNFVSVEIEEGK